MPSLTYIHASEAARTTAGGGGAGADGYKTARSDGRDGTRRAAFVGVYESTKY